MRDPDRRRFLDAVEHIERGDIPFFECDPDMAFVNAFTGGNYPMSLHTYELPIPEYVEINRRMGNDMIYFAHIWRLGRRELTDEAGRIHYIDGTIKGPEALSDIWYPDLDVLERRLAEMCEAVQGTGFGIVCATQPAPFVVATAVGYQDYWLAAVDRPGFIRDFTEIIQEWCLRELELYLRYPIDVIKIGSAFVSCAGPTASPAMLEQIETAYLRQQVAMAKARGLPVYLHVDGKVTSLMPKIIEMGVDILNPIESCGGTQDIYSLKAQYGDRLAFCGNIDINGVLLNGSPEDVRRDVAEHIDRLAGGGGYIVASSHDIHQAIPVANFRAMRDAVHDHRYRTDVAHQ